MADALQNSDKVEKDLSQRFGPITLVSKICRSLVRLFPRCRQVQFIGLTRVTLGLTRTGTDAFVEDYEPLTDDTLWQILETNQPALSPFAMFAPVFGPSGKRLGVLLVKTVDEHNLFTEQDLTALLSIARQAGQSLQNTGLRQFFLDTTLRALYAEPPPEYYLANLDHRPKVPGYQLFDYYQSVYEVGGDYFGYLELADGKIAMAVGDVCGKGVQAGLMMARLSGAVSYCLTTSSSPADAVRRLNHDLCAPTRDSGPTLGERFITFVLCVLDPRNHNLEVVVAGHMAPLVRRQRSQEVEALDVKASGLPLGVNAAESYLTTTINLEPDDCVFLYTDGISEAMNSEKARYGFERVRRFLAHGPVDALELGKGLVFDVSQFTGDSPQHDDVCMVLFRRLKETVPTQGAETD